MAISPILSVLLLGIVFARGGGASPPDSHGTGSESPGAATRVDRAEHMSLGHGYSRRGDHIAFAGVRIDQAGRETLEGFQRSLGRRVTPADHVDAASFVALSEEYAKDKDSVYYKWISPGRFWVVEIPGADPATFEVMDFNLAKDANRVWRTDVPVEGADAPTAQVVNPGWVWKDRHAVYYQSTRLAGADPESFRHLNQAFYRDANHVYWSSTRLEGADASSFRTFGNDIPYAVDAQSVWFGDSRIPQVDAGSFRLLHNHVFADKHGAYVSGRALPVVGADAAAFGMVARLATADCVLFSDGRREYLFDPSYAEIYTLTRTGDSVEVAKPVWFGAATGPVRHAATVSATWKDGALSKPVVAMQPGFERSGTPTWEDGKFQGMTDAIREALTLLAETRAVATDDGRDPLKGHGGQ